jgi:hypothetical protein
MIRKGLLLPDSQPVGVGINGAHRGMADLESESLAVICKWLSEQELAAELFCAVLAREIGLPAPEPLLLFDPTSGGYVFGSVDLQYPNSLRQFNVDPDEPDEAAVQVLLEAVSGWSRAREVAAFDEWIQNCDRNLGNLLFAGPDDFFIIDHGRSLNIYPSLANANVLCGILAEACPDDRALRALLKTLHRVSAQFNLNDADASRASVESTGMPAHPTYAAQFFDLVENRLSTLTALLQNRFPGQQCFLMAPSSP